MIDNVARMSRVFLMACVSFLAVTVGRADEVTQPKTYSVPGERVFPESLDIDQASGLIYTASAETGTLYKGSINGDALDPISQNSGHASGGYGVRVLVSGNVAVARGSSGTVDVFASGGEKLRTLAVENPEGVFLNDLVELPDGRIFVTDSFRPVLYLWQPGESDRLSVWLDLEESEITYLDGFNLNGIVSSASNDTLVMAQTNTGQFWRVDLATQQVSQIDVRGGEGGGDGLRLVGDTLFAVQGDRVSVFGLNPEFTQADLLGQITNGTFDGPTGVAVRDGGVFVTNAQFARQSAAPNLPFLISRVPIPMHFRPSDNGKDE